MGRLRPGQWSLRARLLVLLTLLLVLGLAVTGIVTSYILHRYLVGQVDDKLSRPAARSVIRQFSGGASGMDAYLGDYVLCFQYGSGWIRVIQPPDVQKDDLPDCEPLTADQVDERETNPYSLSSADGQETWRAVSGNVLNPGPGDPVSS